MRWNEGHRSPDIIDRRGDPAPAGGRAGLGTALNLYRAFGWPGALLGLALIAGGLTLGRGRSADAPAPNTPAAAAEDRAARFVGFVLDDAQRSWRDAFARRGGRYQGAQLVLFRGATETACGAGEAATGPFYCPADGRVYIDLDFYADLSRRFGAPGDFAQAYVIAHEIGHHVQHQLGLDRARRGDRAGSVAVELQADCLAGVWARSTAQRGLLEPGDMDEALGAAAAVGDDRMQRAAGRAVNPESFTHGSAAQRAAALRRGYEGGDLRACDVM